MQILIHFYSSVGKTIGLYNQNCHSIILFKRRHKKKVSSPPTDPSVNFEEKKIILNSGFFA